MCTQTSYVDALGAAGLEFTYTSEVSSTEGEVLLVESWLSEPREVWELPLVSCLSKCCPRPRVRQHLGN